MRPAALISLLLGACVFQVPAVDPPAGAAGDDLGGRDGGPAASDFATADVAMPTDGPPPPPDFQLPPDLAGPPDMSIVPVALFALDARSPNAFKTLEQPNLPEYMGQTAGHYVFNEMPGAASLADISPSKNNLAAIGGNFSGNRRAFTHIPGAGGTGFTRVATEFLGAGFAAGAMNLFDVASEDFTVEAWFKIPPGYTATSASACDPLFYKGPQPGYQVCVTSGGKLRMFVSYGMGMSFKQFDTTAGFADGAWHLGTFVFRLNAMNAAALYVDGADLTPQGANDLALPNMKSLTNMAAAFTVGGGGGGSAFHGSLAELVFHDGKVVALGDHVAEYRAFMAPVWPSAANSGDLVYAHDSPVCAVVADDMTAGERVACYGGGPGLAAQFALAMNPNASTTQNPGRLGMLTTPGGFNAAFNSEQINGWTINANALAKAEAAISPRADQTAESLLLRTGTFVILYTSLGGANQTATFSIWLRGKNDGDQVYLRLTDSNGDEFKHCLTTLTARWHRYACTYTYLKGLHPYAVALDTMQLQGDPMPLPDVNLDAWGAQLEIGAAPTPYLPNASAGPLVRAPIMLSVRNPAARYLGGGAGRVSATFTGTDALVDGSNLFDTGPGAADRHVLRRGAGGAIEAQVLDNAGNPAADSLLSLPVGSWLMTHAFTLSWSAVSALPMAPRHIALDFDGAAQARGRAVAYTASTPAVLYLGQSLAGSLQPSGTLHTLTILDGP